MTCRGHEIHREEPHRELGPRLLERRPDTWIDVMAALLAGVGPALGHAVELRIGNAAGRACEDRAAVATLHDLVQAGFVGRILSLERFKGVLHGYPLHLP